METAWACLWLTGRFAAGAVNWTVIALLLLTWTILDAVTREDY